MYPHRNRQVPGVGKTTFADELALVLQAKGRAVIWSSVDFFHHPRAIRYRRERTVIACCEGSHNYPRLYTDLLSALAPDESRKYRTAIYQGPTDTRVDAKMQTAPPGAVLVFDGVFLQRQELVRYWDLTVFL